MRKSSRGAVDPFIVMDVMEAARKAEEAGHTVIHMEVGQPSTPAPNGALEAVRKVLSDDPMGYTVALGIPELRARIAALYDSWYGLDLDPARVVVTSGSSGAFLLTFSALFENGDRVGIGAPGYPSYRQILKALGYAPVVIQADAYHGYQLTPEDIVGQNLQGLMMASPANPTGTMLSRDDMSAIIHAAKSDGVSFISDEIYHGIEYGKKAVSALEVSDDVYVINSFSKYFSMTGWRLGWMVVPPSHVRAVERLAQNMFICAPHIGQRAALAALGCDEELQANLDVYRTNRDLMIEGLANAGFDKIAPPDGAFYVYADVSDYTDNSLEFAAEILEKAHVAVTPGLDFDPERGAHFLRFSYARATADIVEGLNRLTAFMRHR
ncbi:MAG: aminotransferase class I/II-fold pyridoxal phosphate-dependent enzyme [Pseudomonadota bacterium]